VPFWRSPDFKYVRHELKDLKITFARCGEVAWFYCILDDINTYKGEPASWENARWTGVVEKREATGSSRNSISLLRVINKNELNHHAVIIGLPGL